MMVSPSLTGDYRGSGSGSGRKKKNPPKIMTEER